MKIDFCFNMQAIITCLLLDIAGTIIAMNSSRTITATTSAYTSEGRIVDAVLDAPTLDKHNFESDMNSVALQLQHLYSGK